MYFILEQKFRQKVTVADLMETHHFQLYIFMPKAPARGGGESLCILILSQSRSSSPIKRKSDLKSIKMCLSTLIMKC
jgi:hypothetical protein